MNPKWFLGFSAQHSVHINYVTTSSHMNISVAPMNWTRRGLSNYTALGLALAPGRQVCHV